MAPVCEHGGGIELGGESLCGACFRRFYGMVLCPRGERWVVPDKLGCAHWEASGSNPDAKVCFWCRWYDDVRSGRTPGWEQYAPLLPS
ncbi:MAG: hypothetical protein HY684_05135 [Chloroflexi bacterium]|nr:hypothetical protein [Chloroflexota bacterium]